MNPVSSRTNLTLSSQRASRLAVAIEQQLTALAQRLIVPAAENSNFIKDPDDRLEHHVDWHQYGIITHTCKVREAFHNELMPLVAKWGMASAVTERFNQLIGNGWSRGELFEISIPLHDLGKFRRRHVLIGGALTPDYIGHEALSEEIVRKDSDIQRMMSEAGLDATQRTHVARLAGLHFELGKVRDLAKKHNGFTIAFSGSDAALKSYRSIQTQYPEYAVEIGLWYIVDSMGKMSPRLSADTDGEIASSRDAQVSNLTALSLPPTLIHAVLQYPVNLAVGRAYLASQFCGAVSIGKPVS